ncbi:hypothetical protein [Bacillus salacetis]|uniref:hypothetical protein n=1 Tax=Bacillus salacetis TaxID=2315464 RepID=UPI0014440B6A|nr:hypothetical protein [Bacillus salacetis]
MELVFKITGYFVFLIGGFLFYFKGTKTPSKGLTKLHTSLIFMSGFLLLSFLYWFKL